MGDYPGGTNIVTCILAGEREGKRVRADATGGTEVRVVHSLKGGLDTREAGGLQQLEKASQDSPRVLPEGTQPCLHLSFKPSVLVSWAALTNYCRLGGLRKKH